MLHSFGSHVRGVTQQEVQGAEHWREKLFVGCSQEAEGIPRVITCLTGETHNMCEASQRSPFARTQFPMYVYLYVQLGLCLSFSIRVPKCLVGMNPNPNDVHQSGPKLKFILIYRERSAPAPPPRKK